MKKLKQKFLPPTAYFGRLLFDDIDPGHRLLELLVALGARHQLLSWQYASPKQVPLGA